LTRHISTYLIDMSTTHVHISLNIKCIRYGLLCGTKIETIYNNCLIETRATPHKKFKFMKAAATNRTKIINKSFAYRSTRQFFGFPHQNQSENADPEHFPISNGESVWQAIDDQRSTI